MRIQRRQVRAQELRAVCFCNNFNMYGARVGPEAMPHSEFWRDLPNLVREGIAFSVNKVRVLPLFQCRCYLGAFYAALALQFHAANCNNFSGSRTAWKEAGGLPAVNRCWRLRVGMRGVVQKCPAILEFVAETCDHNANKSSRPGPHHPSAVCPAALQIWWCDILASKLMEGFH
jgi:hypothetical protein